jgi:GTP pyrophosphokinase
LVLEEGGGEDEAIAALLHDVVEDCGGVPRLVEVRELFGEGVAAIVAACSDSQGEPKPPWRARKEAYLAHLPQTSPAVRLVSCADKLHNARSILADYRRYGEDLWRRFKGGREGTLWYYRTLVTAYQTAGGPPLLEELARVVAELETLTGT